MFLFWFSIIYVIIDVRNCTAFLNFIDFHLHELVTARKARLQEVTETTHYVLNFLKL